MPRNEFISVKSIFIIRNDINFWDFQRDDIPKSVGHPFFFDNSGDIRITKFLSDFEYIFIVYYKADIPATLDDFDTMKLDIRTYCFQGL